MSRTLALDFRPLERDDYEKAGQLLLAAYPYRAHELASWRRPAPEEAPVRWGVFSSAPVEMRAYAALWRVEGTKADDGFWARLVALPTCAAGGSRPPSGRAAF